MGLKLWKHNLCENSSAKENREGRTGKVLSITEVGIKTNLLKLRMDFSKYKFSQVS